MEIRTIATSDSTQSTSAVASFNWSLPNNLDSTTIDHYNFTLIKTNTSQNDSTSVMLLNTSYTYTQVVTSGNYRVILSAVDLCGQESEPAIMEFGVNPLSVVPFTCETCPCTCSMEIQAIGVLSAFLVCGAVAALVAAIVIIILIHIKCKESTSTRKYYKENKDNQKTIDPHTNRNFAANSSSL